MFLSSIIKLFRLFIFLLVVFAVSRLLFLLYFSNELKPNSLWLIPTTLVKALPLDVSTASYLLFIPTVLLSLGFLFSSQIVFRILIWYMYVVAVTYFFFGIGEVGVYREMHIKVYYSAFARIFHPSEILTYLSPVAIVAIVITLLLTAVFSAFSFRKIAGELTPGKTEANLVRILSALFFLLISSSVLVIGCRGGLQPIPINEGGVSFSNNQCANDAAINSFWNLGHSYLETQKAMVANTYTVMEDTEAKKIVHSLFEVSKDTTISLFKLRRPNICILILEGWHADLIESLGGYKNVTPNFERLVNKGYLFTEIKSSGHISDQGIPAILGAYPALTFGSVINQSEKQLNIPCIGKGFSDENYYTSFLYGGQLIYGGIRKFISLNKFNSIAEQKNFPQLDAGSVGIHDSLMINVWRDSLKQFREPFFSCFFTLSTHVPFDIPTYFPIDWGGSENLYLNSVAYADRQLGRFFDEIEKANLYDSTIFILVSDHGHHTPANHGYDSPKHYHIPLLFCGGALKEEFRGIKDNRTGSQLDIASTIFHQLGINTNEFVWSKNLMNPYTKAFAFYAFNDGFGYVEAEKSVTWNRKFAKPENGFGVNKQEHDSLHKKGAALLQELMNDFLKR